MLSANSGSIVLLEIKDSCLLNRKRNGIEVEVDIYPFQTLSSFRSDGILTKKISITAAAMRGHEGWRLDPYRN